jgi:hypothetical protein
VAETALTDLMKVQRWSDNGTEQVRAPIYRGVRAARSPATADGLVGGRTVQRTTDRWQYYNNDMLRRPFGREEQTINALRTLRDLDPTASHAVWNYLRMVNPGHDLRAYMFDGEGSETKEEGPAQAYLDDLARRVGSEYGGGLDQLHNVLALCLVTSGAVCAEVAPTADLSDIEDWYPVDPALIAFRRDEDGTLVMGQRFRNNAFVALNPNQVFYVPLDPDVDDPYGRPPLLPALSTAIAKGQMINDLRAVAHNQGYPRLDVKIDWKAIREAAPPQLSQPGSEEAFKNWTEEVLATIVTDYEALQVDDTFVHYDWVDIGMVGGAAGVGAFDFASLEKILSRQLNSALKTLPILLGINETTSETHGSIQWQIQSQGVAALQRLIKRVIEKLANTSLLIAGYQAHSKVEYEKIRTVDRLFEAQSDFFETRTIQIQEMQGWRSHDEAAEIITGHEAAGPIVNTKLPAPNLSTNAGGDTSEGGGTADSAKPEPAQAPSSTAAGVAAWQALMESASEASLEPDQVRSANARWASLRAVRQRPNRTTLGHDALSALADKYAELAKDNFLSAYEDCVRLLREEGYEFERSVSEWDSMAHRDLAKDISDYVFGTGYSRDMKRLLRDAFEEGMRRAMSDAESDAEIEIDKNLIERVWRVNRQFVVKLRNELQAAIRDREFTSLTEVRAWFETRMWREDLMGRFLAKQGVAAGYAYGMSIREGGLLFSWTTSGSADSCPTCLGRSGQTFSYDELVSLGFPGSIELECGANCRCFLEPQ